MKYNILHFHEGQQKIKMMLKSLINKVFNLHDRLVPQHSISIKCNLISVIKRLLPWLFRRKTMEMNHIPFKKKKKENNYTEKIVSTPPPPSTHTHTRTAIFFFLIWFCLIISHSRLFLSHTVLWIIYSHIFSPSKFWTSRFFNQYDKSWICPRM